MSSILQSIISPESREKGIHLILNGIVIEPIELPVA